MNQTKIISVGDLGLLAQIVCPCGHVGLVSTNYIRGSWGLNRTENPLTIEMINFYSQTENLLVSYRYRLSPA